LSNRTRIDGGKRAQAFTDKARQTIGEFPESPYQRALLAVTDLITERDH
jgi:geranylgeranyl pyrophosphate synthase